MSTRKLLPMAAAVLAVVALSACSNTRSTTTTTTERGITETRTVRTEQPRDNRSSRNDNRSSSSSDRNDHSGACRVTRPDEPGGGRNVLLRCDGRRVLATEEAKRLLMPDVPVSFGRSGSVIAAGLTSRQSANASNRSDEAACERAFINAVRKFQETARSRGGNRVSNFHSYFDRQTLTGGQNVCQAGTFHARVVMRGDIAR